jgi:hypothetical protein
MTTTEPLCRLDPSAQQEVERHIHLRTGRRVRNLLVELEAGRIVLRGTADSYYVKQLAQHGVLDLFPDIALHNDIAVDNPGWCQVGSAVCYSVLADFSFAANCNAVELMQ